MHIPAYPIPHRLAVWSALESDIKRYFGLEAKKKWPDQGMPSQTIAGIRVFVLGKEEAKREGHFHRARAICPKCDASMSAGRLNQHVC